LLIFRAHGVKIPDLILKFGEYTVLVEVKFSGAPLFEVLDCTVLQTSSYLELSGISRGTIVLFYPGELPGPYETVKTPEKANCQ